MRDNKQKETVLKRDPLKQDKVKHEAPLYVSTGKLNYGTNTNATFVAKKIS